MQAQALGFVVPGFLGNEIGVLGVLGDVVIDFLGLGIFAAAEELVRPGQVTLGGAFDTSRLGLEAVALKHQTLGWSGRRLGRVKNVELIPLPNAAGQIPHERADDAQEQWPHGSPATEEEPDFRNQIPKLNDFGSWFLALGSWLLVLGSWLWVPDAHAHQLLK